MSNCSLTLLVGTASSRPAADRIMLRTPSIATSAKLAYLYWGKSCRDLSGYRVKSNEAVMHDIVGCYRNVASRISRTQGQFC